MVGLGDHKTCKLLDHGGLAPASSCTPVPRLLLELSRMPMGLKPLPTSPMNVTMAAARANGVSLADAENIHELFQARAGVAFPKSDAAVEEATQGPGCLVMASQYQQGRLIMFESIYLFSGPDRKSW